VTSLLHSREVAEASARSIRVFVDMEVALHPTGVNVVAMNFVRTREHKGGPTAEVVTFGRTLTRILIGIGWKGSPQHFHQLQHHTHPCSLRLASLAIVFVSAVVLLREIVRYMSQQASTTELWHNSRRESMLQVIHFITPCRARDYDCHVQI
jgi:hypothetical protein